MLITVGTLLAVWGAPSGRSLLVALVAPVAVLWPAALIWALSIRRALRLAPQVPGRIVETRLTWRGLLSVDFVYVVQGVEVKATNSFMPRSAAMRLEADQIVNVAVSRTPFPGPLIVDVYT